MAQNKSGKPRKPKAVALASVETPVRLHLPNGLLKRADADLSDLTDCQRTGPARWEEGDVLVLDFDCAPTDAEKTAIRRRLVTANAADEQRLNDLIAARAATTDADLFERLWLDTELAKYGETTEAT